jgi:hypothetical protein
VSLEIEFDLRGLDELVLKARAGIAEGVPQALEHIRGVSAEQTPIETGHLVGSAEVHAEGMEGSIRYPGPYARYQHYELQLHHEHGNALYLEIPMVTEAGVAFTIVTRKIRDKL